MYADGTSNPFELAWHGYRAPANATVPVLVRLTNPNLTIADLCSNKLYSDLSVFMLPITASGNGRFVQAKPVMLPYDEKIANHLLFAQAVALDRSQKGPPFAAANGVEIVLPEVAGDREIKRLYKSRNATAVTGDGPDLSGLATKIG